MQEIKQGGRSTRKGEIYKRTVEYMQNERKWNIYKKERKYRRRYTIFK